MNRKDVYSALSASGVPVAHMAWPKNSAPPLPWLVYYLEQSSGFYADNEKIIDIDEVVVELYQLSADSEVEQKVEAAISARFGGFSKQEQWIDQEDCLMTVYRFENVERIPNG